MSISAVLFGHNRFRSGSGKGGLIMAAVLTVLLMAGCASRKTPAPVTDLTGGASAGQTQAVHASVDTYTVRPGDTLYSIARAHDLNVTALANINDISDPGQLKVGQTLRLGTFSAPATSQPTVQTPSGVQTASVQQPVEIQAVDQSPSAPQTTTRAADAGLVAWGWPLSGEIIQSFNSSTKGIDIAGTTGTPVVAAADGEVMYVGNGVRGLGNLVLIGHGNQFISAYAHNDALLVQTGKKVKKGEKIATVGQSDTTSPRLHFEIRRDGTPVNPLSYLPPK